MMAERGTVEAVNQEPAMGQIAARKEGRGRGSKADHMLQQAWTSEVALEQVSGLVIAAAVDAGG
jgi:hypothetical protein